MAFSKNLLAKSSRYVKVYKNYSTYVKNGKIGCENKILRSVNTSDNRIYFDEEEDEDDEDAWFNKQLMKKNPLSKTVTIPFEGPVDVSLLHGIPKTQIKSRRVRIFKPRKNSMQSGTSNLGHWEIEFDAKPRWENPTTGWCSTGDPLSSMELRFSTKEEAIEFCRKNGWKWYVSESCTEKKFKLRPYGNNFRNTRSRVSTK